MLRTQSKEAEEGSCRWGTWAGGQHTTSQFRLASNLCRAGHELEWRLMYDSWRGGGST
jgi:hypothetical protein